VGKPEGRRLLLRPRHRWEDIIKTGITKYGMGRHGQDLSGLG
jgi:hypothetical protein